MSKRRTWPTRRELLPTALSRQEKEMTKRALASVERLLWYRERGKDVPAHFPDGTARTDEPKQQGL